MTLGYARTIAANSTSRPRQSARRRVTALVVTITVLAAAGCSEDEPDPADPQPENALELPDDVVGKCLKFDEEQDANVFELPYIGCDQEHTHQIFHTFENEFDVYPGFDALESNARTKCLDGFVEFVGRNPFDSALFYTWLVPSFDGWNAEESDIVTICLLGARDNKPFTGSMEGKNV